MPFFLPLYKENYSGKSSSYGRLLLYELSAFEICIMAITLAVTPTATSVVTKEDIPFARHDPALCSLPGLFRVVSDDLRTATRVALRLRADHGPLTIELHNSTLLNGLDLAVLQALVALAVTGDTIAPAEKDFLTNDERELVKGLEAPATYDYKRQRIVEEVQHLHFSNSALLELIGWSVCRDNRALVQACLQRLATCVMIVYPKDNPKMWQRFHLLSTINTRADTDRWSRTHVALNPRLSQIVLGNARRHTRIALDETRQLGKHQAARILHQRLCAWIDEGATRSVTYATLVGYLYPNDAEGIALEVQAAALDPKLARQSAAKRQLQRLHEMATAINTLAALPGWAAYLASDAPFVPTGLTERERSQEERQHYRRCDKQRMEAAKDVMRTVVNIRRGESAALLRGRQASPTIHRWQRDEAC